MLLPSGGGGGDAAAAAAVVPRPCIWSGMMIRTGWLLAGLGCLALEVAGKPAGGGRHATGHAGGEPGVYLRNIV